MTDDEILALAALTGNEPTDAELIAFARAIEQRTLTNQKAKWYQEGVEAGLRQALAEPPNSATDVVESEPVAWGMQNADGQITDVITPEEHDRVEGAYTIPLYTAPPKEKNHGQ
jgi:hypothetical protein